MLLHSFKPDSVPSMKQPQSEYKHFVSLKLSLFDYRRNPHRVAHSSPRWLVRIDRTYVQQRYYDMYTIRPAALRDSRQSRARRQRDDNCTL